jgi:hypothetical protein
MIENLDFNLFRRVFLHNTFIPHIMATANNQNTLLERAIDNADEKTLRVVLKAMCKDSKECRTEAMGRMLVSRKHVLIELSDSSDDNTQRRSKKQKKGKPIQKEFEVSRYEICETCKETFDITLNHNESCQTHDGELMLYSIRATALT